MDTYTASSRLDAMPEGQTFKPLKFAHKNLISFNTIETNVAFQVSWLTSDDL